MNVLGNKIKSLRKEKNITQEQLAKGVVTRGYISQIEKGLVVPSRKILKKLSEKLEVEEQDLFEEQMDSVEYQLGLTRTLKSLEYAVQTGEYESASQLLTELNRHINQFTDQEVAIFYFCYGKYVENEKKDEITAIDYYIKSFNLLKNTELIQEKIRTLNHLIRLLIKLNKLREAFNYLDTAYDDSIFYKVSGEEKINLLMNMGVGHAKSGEYYSAIRHLKQVIQLSNEINLYNNLGITYMVLGLCYRRIEYFEQSKDSYEQALHFFIIIKDDLNRAGTLTNLGVLSRYTKEIHKSKEYLLSAKSIYEILSDQEGLLNVLYELGVTSFALKEFEDVKHYHKIFISLNSNSTDVNLQIIYKFHVLLGDLNLELRVYDKAVQEYKEGFNIIKNKTETEKEKEELKSLIVKLIRVYCLTKDERKFEAVSLLEICNKILS